ncbi:aldose epimerase [Actinotalea sp. K2]|uniref:aldose epimerase family protein n=1 Tax=Actinotalea sp. K2 TaxID=2939438 RepID=UPI002016ECE1|nr:aldose epimerase [Actinotalea sp. K2]MCL3861036.1 aldose epimerase [Actinotalea sp. K2]
MAPEVLVIENDCWRVGVLPGTGASLDSGQVRLDGVWRDVLRPTRPAGRRRYPQCASYVLVPFSNRVRDGMLRFGDRSWQLRRNAADGTAMHGAAHEYPWAVVARTPTSVTAEFDAGAVVGVNFPWTFTARVTYALDGPRLSVRTELTNTDVEAFPAGFGHHPYFQRGLVDPTVSEVRVRIPTEASHPLERGMAVGPPGPLASAADYRTLRPLARLPFVDVCLTRRTSADTVHLEWPASGLAVRMRADDVFSHTVLYVPRGRPWFAVEPVTHANDGFTLRAEGIEGHGVVVLGPGETLTGTFDLTAEPLDPATGPTGRRAAVGSTASGPEAVPSAVPRPVAPVPVGHT